jgi:predicted NACHT family NTPase
MAERSLRATPEGIKKAKKAFKDQGWTQTQIGEEIGTTRQPVGKFFAGKPIERPNFIDICCLLDLSWEDIAEPEPAEEKQNNSINIDALVQEVRENIKPNLERDCGTMKVLDMSQPIGLNDIYTNVNILETITGRRRKGIYELQQECNSEDFERFGLGKITQERVPGLEAVKKYPKLMILGKPGAGKTTFLKYLAIQCNRGEFQAGWVPIFVTLKDFAEALNKPGLLEYIAQIVGQASRLPLEHSKPNAHRRQDACATDIERLLSQGRMLILLDGLDEVREEDSQRILKEIRDFSDRFGDNHFVMTCRIAAREYTFEKFTEVEVADFDDEQISTFASNWFKGKAVKAESFIQRLDNNNRTKELATNPLLLTLLCLAFEESGDFPANRSELYKEGLDALLKKWDAKRGIYRDQVYKKLSTQRKEDLLSKIALTTFEQGDYFFKQKAAEQYIRDYIRNLPNANTDPEALQLDSEVVLRSIEAQHGLLVERAKGIYSFSHLTFHEYFTAREIVVGKQASGEALQNLVSYITDKRWREVFLLAVGMSPSADGLLLLMKQQSNSLMNTDEKLQQFLRWVNEKSLSIEASYDLATIREFYINFESTDTIVRHQISRHQKTIYASSAQDIDIATRILLYYGETNDLYDDRGLRLMHIYSPDFELDNALISSLDHASNLASANVPSFDTGSKLSYTLNRAITSTSDSELQRALRRFKQQIPDPDKNRATFKTLWKARGKVWTEQLRAVMTKQRNIGHNWQFSDEQKKVLREYCNINLLLMDCLNSDVVLTPEVRSQIEDTLLLPIDEIENSKHRE